MKKTVIVLGTWSSGSGAVSDYLSSRKDFINPFGTNEFKIISDPMGLHHLFINLYKTKSLLYPTFAFENFEKYIHKLEKYIVYSSPGVKKKLYNYKLLEHTKYFLNKIIKISYFGYPHYKDVTIDLDKRISLKLKRKFLSKNFAEQKILSIVSPVAKADFIKYSKQYIQNVLKSSCKSSLNNKNIVLNNGADILDPITSSQYYKNPKIICVLRDPRDIFCGMKIRQANSTPWYDVKIFIKWYKYHFGNKKFRGVLKNNRILVIKFEDFILNFDKENKRICKFLNINKNISFKKNNKLFNIEFSRSNIYKSKKFLSKNELKLIKKNLRKYLQW
tara:strand:- start:86 stop:1081 length:996 start_codon:yes stop_codon:yes gene_type:complete